MIMVFLKWGLVMTLGAFISKPVLQAVLSETFQQDPLTKQTSAAEVSDALGKLSLFSEVCFQPSVTIYLGFFTLHAKH